MSPISFAQRLAGASKVLAIFVVVALFVVPGPQGDQPVSGPQVSF